MTSTTELPSPVRTTPFGAWLLLTVLIIGAMAYLRFVLFPDRLVPLSYGVGLLVCLWHRDLRLLYGSAAVFSVLATYKAAFMLAPGGDYSTGYLASAITMSMLNIWVVAGTVHGLVRLMQRLESKKQRLEAANHELEASNEELAAREEEIAHQNEELQSQTEELEQQAEELRQQTEEMEHQSAELQSANEELSRREKGLQTLLNSARWLRGDLAEQDVVAAICQAAVEVIDDVAAAAVVQDKDGIFSLHGHWGFGLHGAIRREFEFSRSFAALVLEKGRTAYIEDLSTRQDIEAPQPVVGQPFRSVLAAPVWMDGEAVAVIEVYSHRVRAWSGDEFHVAEWLAAQTALAMRSVEYQRELELKRREAEEASVQKTHFLAAISHDVRTPANAISLMAELVERISNEPENVGQLPPMLSDLKSNARALAELVSDVLDLTRFDAGRLDLQVSNFALHTLIDSEIRQFQSAADEKGLRLQVTLPETAVWLSTDRLKLARVLSNLIGNAVKFTERGEVSVTCTRHEDGMIGIAVKDTGNGITHDEVPRIFDEFYQLRNPERDRSKGNGLGLAICRRLIDVLGCSISVDSTPGKGTTFLLQLPSELSIAAPQSSSAENHADEPTDRNTQLQQLDGTPILLVEDHETTRIAMSRLLKRLGAKVFHAASCREAIQILAHERPHVLLLDLMLPDKDGTEVLRYLQFHRPPTLKGVLAISGDVRESRIKEVMQLGANELIPKPITTSTLLAAMQRCLTAGGKPDQDGGAHYPELQRFPV